MNIKLLLPLLLLSLALSACVPRNDNLKGVK